LQGQFSIVLASGAPYSERRLTHNAIGILGEQCRIQAHVVGNPPREITDDEWDRLFAATRGTLELWLGRLCAGARARFPEKVTAFREGMAVHGRYGEPCRRCGAKVLRIRYADNQTGGRVLAAHAR
jgi:hypothetical protein